MKYETAGEPTGGCKWTRKTTGKIAKLLKCIGIHVSAKQLADFSKKMFSSISESWAGRPLADYETGMDNSKIFKLRQLLIHKRVAF